MCLRAFGHITNENVEMGKLLLQAGADVLWRIGLSEYRAMIGSLMKRFLVRPGYPVFEKQLGAL